MESPSISRPLPHQSSHVRSPLSISTNSSPIPQLPPISSPLPALPQGRTIRRKASLSYKKKDSSEELPSSDGSGIYNARTYSQSSSSDNSSKPENASSVAANKQPNWENWDSSRTSSLSIIGRTPIIYGNCTPLDTITEKNSNSTLQTLRHSTSVDALSKKHSRTALAHQDSQEISRVQRQRSFSLDDLTKTRLSYHEACSSIARVESNRPQLHLDNIAQPQIPLLAPPARASTPPGMPSWTALQERRAPPRTSSNNRRDRILSWWGVHSRSTEPTVSSSSNTGASSGPRASLPRGVAALPRYRPPRSVYTPLESHPFNRLPTSKTVKPSELSKPKPSWGGITVSTTWSVTSEPALLAQAEDLSRMNVGGHSVTACTSTAVPSVLAPSKKHSCHHPRHNLTSLSNRLSLGSEDQASSHQERPDNHHEHRPDSSQRRLSNIHEEDPVITAVTSDPERDRLHAFPSASLAIPGDGQSSAVISPCPALVPDYLVMVTNLEKPRRRDLCWRCYIGSYLHEFGIWIDRHGERFDAFVDRAAKKTCVMCCGFAAGEEGRGMGLDGCGLGTTSESQEPPRPVSLTVDIPSGNLD